MAGQRTVVKNVKLVTDKTTGKTTLKITARAGLDTSAKIRQAKSKKVTVVTAAKAGKTRR